MKLMYDPDADALYIAFKEEKPHKTVEVSEYILADFDVNNYVIGFEILFVSKTLRSADFTDLSFQLPNYPEFHLQLPEVYLNKLKEA